MIQKREPILYIAKCLTGIALTFLVARFVPYIDIAWCLVSIILILSTGSDDESSLALTRIKANLLGVSVSSACLFLQLPALMGLFFAFCLTIPLCYVLSLDGGIKSALAAIIITMLHGEGTHFWDIPIERIIAVFSGCLLALVITFLFNLLLVEKKKFTASD